MPRPSETVREGYNVLTRCGTILTSCRVQTHGFVGTCQDTGKSVIFTQAVVALAAPPNLWDTAYRFYCQSQSSNHEPLETL